MEDNAIVAVADVDHQQLCQLAAGVVSYADAGTSANTKRAYGSSWSSFASWCASVGLTALPAEAATVALYLTARARTLAVSTLALHLAAIAASHQADGHPPPAHPDLDRTWAGIRRTHGRPPRKKRALVVEDLRRALAKLPATPTGIRDRALILVGFAGALRRSELAALTVDGKGAGAVRAVFVAGGLEIHLDKAKGDQEGRGAVVAIPYGRKNCPVAALRAWLDAAKITEGPIFRAVTSRGVVGRQAINDRTVARVVKAACGAAGFDAAAFAGHSLRSGLITTASDKGVDPDVLMRQARHKRYETTQGYIQASDRFRRNAAGKVGL
jgi:integrase